MGLIIGKKWSLIIHMMILILEFVTNSNDLSSFMVNLGRYSHMLESLYIGGSTVLYESTTDHDDRRRRHLHKK